MVANCDHLLKHDEMTKEVNVKIPDEAIINKIIVIRDYKVMIDKDLAELYGITTKRLNEQVKRNTSRFPKDFIFQITTSEKEKIIVQFVPFSKFKILVHSSLCFY